MGAHNDDEQLLDRKNDEELDREKLGELLVDPVTKQFVMVQFVGHVAEHLRREGGQ